MHPGAPRTYTTLLSVVLDDCRCRTATSPTRSNQVVDGLDGFGGSTADSCEVAAALTRAVLFLMLVGLSGACVNGASPGLSQADGPVMPEDRLIEGSPLLSTYEYCYGECRALARTPQFALYDDGTLVRTGYVDGGDFFIEAATLSTGEVAELVELGRSAGLSSGLTASVGELAGSDGAGTVFISEVGERTTFVHAPHLHPLYGNIETDEQADLLEFVTELERLGEEQRWQPMAVAWAVFAHRRSSGSAEDVVWTGPSLDLVDVDGCLVLGSLDEDPVVQGLVESADATFGLRLISADWSWLASVRPMMPHETDCEDVKAHDGWFRDTNDQILMDLR